MLTIRDRIVQEIILKQFPEIDRAWLEVWLNDIKSYPEQGRYDNLLDFWLRDLCNEKPEALYSEDKSC